MKEIRRFGKAVYLLVAALATLVAVAAPETFPWGS